MRALLAISRIIDTVNGRIGRAVAWLIVVAAVISATNAVFRKAFDLSSNAWLEAQWLLFGAVFLFAAPWTLSVNEHIRIDVVNTLLPRWARDAIDVAGHALFLLPIAAVVVYTSWPFFAASYLQNEQSLNAGGLPQWPAKALIPFAFALLFVQGLSELIKRLAIVTGHATDGGRHAASTPAEGAAARIGQKSKMRTVSRE